MIVYGDHDIEMGLDDFVTRFRHRLARSCCSGSDVDEARVLLILAGQLEQAVADAGLPCHDACRSVTCHAAEAMLAARRGCSDTPAAREIERELTSMVAQQSSRAPLRLRTPEGFAWYALYPDAYAQAAETWAQEQRSQTALVIGLRSIGTTLAAVVTASLRAGGMAARSITVRPRGHPFARLVDLPANLPAADHFIVVDEGPGLSGSSMASVAAALAERGCSAASITFLPGHGHGPGPEASSEVRDWWRIAPTLTVPFEGVRLTSSPSASVETLAEIASDLLGEPLRKPLCDIGGGRWRDVVTADDRLDAAPRLEAPKLLARGVSGRGLVWKFAGLCLAAPGDDAALQTMCERKAAQMSRLAELGLTPAALATAHGWIALPWIEGRHLTARDASASALARIARQIRCAAGPPLAPATAKSAAHRLGELLVVNTRELLGAAAASRAAHASDMATGCLQALDLPSYGDGRLAPREWVETPSGMLKVDAEGHADDHTWIGPQSILWDIAGAAVEWRLDDEGTRSLAELAGISCPPLPLRYAIACYAAFRAAVADLCRSDAKEPSEVTRLTAALAFYRGRLATELECLDALTAAPSG